MQSANSPDSPDSTSSGDIFYIGSCRYQALFQYNSIAYLFTSAEALNLLRQLASGTLTPNYKQFYPSTDPQYVDRFRHLANTFQLNSIKTLVLEVSSRKLLFPINRHTRRIIKTYPHCHMGYGANRAYMIRSHQVAAYTQSDADIASDLLQIRNIIGPNVRLVVISHIDPPPHIPDRHDLVQALRRITSGGEGGGGELNCLFVDPVSLLPHGIVLTDVLPDGRHFADDECSNPDWNPSTAEYDPNGVKLRLHQALANMMGYIR